jgi:hypothetical protein
MKVTSSKSKEWSSQTNAFLWVNDKKGKQWNLFKLKITQNHTKKHGRHTEKEAQVKVKSGALKQMHFYEWTTKMEKDGIF